MRRTGAALAVAVVLAGITACGPARTAGVLTPVHSVDFATDQAANLKAQIAADGLTPQIERDPTYAGLAILSDGLTVWAVGGGSPQLRAAVARVGAVPVHIRPARNSWAALQALTRQLTHDWMSLSRTGTTLSSWGPDVTTNTVRVTLTSDDPRRAANLVTEYGANRLTVSPGSQTNSAS